ncbi:nuclear transport factor 2 family protein [Nesterenkonia ebinurensis]|uniref:nuclear transport factor 2 family protein n=1 Tax=Nesterenkonia ebinurensis TaxID=2608252 RepID=UPI00123D34B4|nr:nuclear transport factor 2 family protein [Nesterenkonia ebinurensis]
MDSPHLPAMVLPKYMDAWIAGSPERIADLLTEDGVVIECYGPVYRGRERVLQWAETWLCNGGVVHSWDIISSFATNGREATEWVFDFTWQDRRRSFEGATIAEIQDGKIASLREYRTTGELYDWTGTWD